MKIEAARIKSYVERVKKLVEEQKAIGADITQVCKDAKGDGYEPTFIRFAVRELLIDEAERTERDEKRDMYLNAVGVGVDLVRDHGLSLRQAEAISGASKSSIQRALAVPACPTVEMVEGDLGTVDAASTPPREMTADDLGDPLLVTDRDRGRFRDKVRTLAATIKPVAVERSVIDDAEIDLTIPEFLRAVRAA